MHLKRNLNSQALRSASLLSPQTPSPASATSTTTCATSRDSKRTSKPQKPSFLLKTLLVSHNLKRIAAPSSSRQVSAVRSLYSCVLITNVLGPMDYNLLTLDLHRQSQVRAILQKARDPLQHHVQQPGRHDAVEHLLETKKHFTDEPIQFPCAVRAQEHRQHLLHEQYPIVHFSDSILK